MNNEDKLCWFHGKVTRDRAEQILREDTSKDGTFLVRDSNTSDGDFVLSVRSKADVWHYQIRRHGEDAFFSIDDQIPIHGLDTLIEHYQEAANGLVTQLLASVKCEPPPPDARSHGRTNLLHRATKEGNFTVVSELLKCGYRNIDAKNQDGQTAVHLACMHSNGQMVQKLIDSGANVNCRDSKGNTPLHYACKNRSADVVEMLIVAKGNIQARNNETGCVPLHEAARQGNMPAVSKLLQLGAPHMPRSTYGELPIDYANEGGHHDIAKYLEHFNPEPATVYKFQWYHGTLDRQESIQILKRYAATIGDGQSKTTTTTSSSERDSNYSSGVFLVRYSAKTGDYVLTLLFDNQPKHFIIQKYLKYLYIDEGPYMPSLEHLIQHYMHFSDGLPTNLRYAVPPTPKPPLPLFSTIPKSSRLKHSLHSPESNLDNANASPRQPTVRNMSIPNDEMMNTIGIMSSSPKDDAKTRDLLNFRSLKLKSPKKNIIIDGMKSLKKTKKAKPVEIKDIDTDLKPIELSLSLRNLSFSSDLKVAVDTSEDTLYNVPTNNAAVDDLHNKIIPPLSSKSEQPFQITNQDNNDVNDTLTDNYFTASDSEIRASQEKGCEDMYFVDAPTIGPRSPAISIQYTAFRHLPCFPDGTQIPTENAASNAIQLDRLDSMTSLQSTMSEQFFRQQSNVDVNHPMSLEPLQNLDPLADGIAEVKPIYFIPKSNLELLDVLGVGEFGSVIRGTFYIDGGAAESSEETVASCRQSIPVAIKTLHDEHCKQNRAEFLREASLMIKLAHHCIVKMIGISRGPPLMMVQELVSLGSMLDYILQYPEECSTQVELKLWASQIACGMHYLESHHFVHRDLAARNILLATKNQAKISDFGLSRALCTGNDYYQASQGGKWPIKWYAPESFNYGTFSHASDVWSFGVTLWEMFSYGQAPYGEMKGVDVIKLVEIGQRLPSPEQCPDHVFRVMENCWNYSPKDRPSFWHLMQFFSSDPAYQNLVKSPERNDQS